MSGRGGYILVEAAVAMVLLGIGSFAVHGTIQEALRTRGQAQDYTHARFLMEQVVADLELQPQLTVHSKQGRFSGENDRFSWAYSVRRVDVPKPTAPLSPPPKGEKKKKRKFEYGQGRDYLAHVRATVTWRRGGREFSESYETLLGTDKLWQPPKPKDRL